MDETLTLMDQEVLESLKKNLDFVHSDDNGTVVITATFGGEPIKSFRIGLDSLDLQESFERTLNASLGQVTKAIDGYEKVQKALGRVAGMVQDIQNVGQSVQQNAKDLKDFVMETVPAASWGD